MGQFVAPAAGGEQSVQGVLLLQQGGLHLLLAEGVNVLVGIVQNGTEMGHQIHQSGVDPTDLAAEDTPQLSGSVAGTFPALGIQKIGHSLGLYQV